MRRARTGVTAGRASAAIAVVAALALGACDAEPPSAMPPPACTATDARPGLVPLAGSSVDDGFGNRGHSRELVLDGDLIFIADANGLPTLRWSAGGGLELLHGVQPERIVHCSSVALHAASRTLVCVAGDHGLFGLVDVRDPAAPVVRPWPVETLPPFALPSVPDVTITGDTVWLAAQDLGLLRTTLDGSGSPTAIEILEIGSEVVQVEAVQVEAVGDRLVLLDRNEGLVVLDATTLERLGAVAIDAPPIDLAVDGDRIVVSGGSEGVRVFELDASGRPVPLVEVQPRCVATAADLDGDRLAVACLTGLTLYDLSGSEPRVAGFVAAQFGMLDVMFAPFGLIAADWYRVDVFATDLGGIAMLPEAPRGMRLAPGLDAHVPIRNPGGEALPVAWELRDFAGRARLEGTLELPPGGEAIVDLPADALEAAGSRDNRADLVLSRIGACDHAVTRTRVWHRRPEDDPAGGRVSIGDPFPTLTRTSPSTAPDQLPTPGAPTLVMFLTVDCYLQWPQLEDMAWAQDHGTGQPAPTILYLTTWNEDPFDPTFYTRNFDAERLLTVEWADYQGSVPGADLESVPVRAFEQTFMMDLPGADFPHDYHVDDSGTVTATSRAYRGRWRLGE